MPDGSKRTVPAGVIEVCLNYSEKKQQFSLLHKLVNRWRILQNFSLFIFLAQPVLFIGGASELEK